jgi:two-component system, cell cycle sensor histidine kinase and response regulator CckA
MDSDVQPTSPLAVDAQPADAVILVVDDDAAVRQVTARVLQRAGYRVLQAAEGTEALTVARSYDGKLDLLLTDVVMPGMNGRELGELMTQERPETRLLYMSAYTEDEIILRGVRVAEVNFLYKPFSLEGLAAAVRQVLTS